MTIKMSRTFTSRPSSNDPTTICHSICYSTVRYSTVQYSTSCLYVSLSCSQSEMSICSLSKILLHFMFFPL